MSPKRIRLKMGEAASQLSGIAIADAEHNPCSRIRPHSTPNGIIPAQLLELLVGKDKAQPIFARAREDFGHGWCDEILELIGIKGKKAPVGLRHPLPGHGHLLDLRDD